MSWLNEMKDVSLTITSSSPLDIMMTLMALMTMMTRGVMRERITLTYHCIAIRQTIPLSSWWYTTVYDHFSTAYLQIDCCESVLGSAVLYCNAVLCTVSLHYYNTIALLRPSHNSFTRIFLYILVNYFIKLQ